ncbi:hypothetical protein ACIPSE_43540 [Streptomyces sp. NPDC090106]|uniref:hypothetical protein n=1 Tax=Streptomyces sp. NPDC090106 TaxID=3365946 RepID=UPI003806CF90
MQQVLAESGRRVGGEVLAIEGGGAKAGVLEGPRLGLVQQQVLDSCPEHGVRGELRPPLGAAGQHRPACVVAQLQRQSFWYADTASQPASGSG